MTLEENDSFANFTQTTTTIQIAIDVIKTNNRCLFPFISSEYRRPYSEIHEERKLLLNILYLVPLVAHAKECLTGIKWPHRIVDFKEY